MRAMRAIAVGIGLAALGAAPAQAATPELGASQRLEDRREVAAGTRAQVLGFQDGRFYANGWHITGEMGGIVTPPLKLLDSVYFGVKGRWVGPATRFKSGWGYVRYKLPSIDGIRLRRTDFAPDAPARRADQAEADEHAPHQADRPRDGRRPLRADDPVPLEREGQGAERERQRARRAWTSRRKLVFRDTGRLPGEARNHSYTAIVGSNRVPRTRTTGPGHYGPFGAGRRCAADQKPEPMPRDCDDGPFGRGTGGRLRYKVRLPAGGRAAVWIAVAGSENSVAEARSEFGKLITRPGRKLAAKQAARTALARKSRLVLPGNALLQRSIAWGKQNLADLTQTARELEIRWTDEGRQWTFEGDVPRIGWVGAGFPDYPWLFAVDGAYTAHASVALGQFGPIKAHMRAVRDISELLSDRSGVVVHEVVADGSVWHGKDNRVTDPATGDVTYDFNTDEIVKFPGAVALIWRWTGDDGFRDEMLDFTRRNLEYVRTRLDADGDGWPEGNGNVERPGMGEEKLDNAVYYIRALYDYADMARSAGQAAKAAAAEARADGLAARFEDAWWMEDEAAYADSLRRPRRREGQPEALDRRDADGGRAARVGEIVPGLASFEHGSAALAARENSCYSGERPGNRGLFHTGCEGGPAGAGEFAIFSLNTAIQAVGEGNYGRLGALSSAATPTPMPRPSSPSRRPAGRRTSNRARCRRSCRRSRPAAPSARRRTSTAAGPAARCSRRPGATTPRPGRSCTSSSACGRSSVTACSRSSRRSPTGSRACRGATSASAAARWTCSRRTTASATRRPPTRPTRRSGRSASGTRCRAVRPSRRSSSTAPRWPSPRARRAVASRCGCPRAPARGTRSS